MADHTGSILFHCWRHDPIERARKILGSIVTKGFLLTTTNAGALDSFTVRDGDNQFRNIEVMQRARICFTDIPLELLATHGSAYGRYGLGFTREQVIEWGGCPAWYLPNHHGGDSLKDNGPVLVNGLHAAMVALDSYHAAITATEKAFKSGAVQQHFFTQNFTHGKTLVGDELINWVAYARNSVERMLSFIKEMSPADTEDFRYLYEREWRIVEGLQILGSDPCRVLSDSEKAELCVMNPNWKKVAEVHDINVKARHAAMPLIETFRIFNGAVMNSRIAQNIVMILVPNEDEKRFVENLIRKRPKAFRAEGLEIKIFPS